MTDPPAASRSPPFCPAAIPPFAPFFRPHVSADCAPRPSQKGEQQDDAKIHEDLVCGVVWVRREDAFAFPETRTAGQSMH